MVVLIEFKTVLVTVLIIPIIMYLFVYNPTIMGVMFTCLSVHSSWLNNWTSGHNVLGDYEGDQEGF